MFPTFRRLIQQCRWRLRYQYNTPLAGDRCRLQLASVKVWWVQSRMSREWSSSCPLTLPRQYWRGFCLQMWRRFYSWGRSSRHRVTHQHRCYIHPNLMSHTLSLALPMEMTQQPSIDHREANLKYLHAPAPIPILICVVFPACVLLTIYYIVIVPEIIEINNWKICIL